MVVKFWVTVKVKEWEKVLTTWADYVLFID